MKLEPFLLKSKSKRDYRDTFREVAREYVGTEDVVIHGKCRECGFKNSVEAKFVIMIDEEYHRIPYISRDQLCHFGYRCAACLLFNRGEEIKKTTTPRTLEMKSPRKLIAEFN